VNAPSGKLRTPAGATGHRGRKSRTSSARIWIALGIGLAANAAWGLMRWAVSHGFDRIGVPHGALRQVYGSLLNAVVLICLCTLLVKWSERATLRAAFASLGIAKWRHGWSQLLVAAVATIPIAVILVLPAGWIGERWELGPGARESFTFLALAVAFPEELVFRGFIYSRLRVVTGVTAATALSAVLFGLAHITSFVQAYSAGALKVVNPVDVGMAIGVPILFSIPVARLFERGGGCLWGPVAAHFGFDLVYGFRLVHSGGPHLFQPMWLAQGLFLVVLYIGSGLIGRSRSGKKWGAS